MAPVATPEYNKQISTDSGWDNPFRPDGDLSREADEIVNLIKGGKQITPNGEQMPINEQAPVKQAFVGDYEATRTVMDESIKLDVSSPIKQWNSTNSPRITAANGSSPQDDQLQSVNQTILPDPQSTSRVVIVEKKKKSSKCCVIQ